ncbi:general secretion pathway protein GspK [Pseudoxanthomonas gei]|uniref:General secretion pathway protein GspK n=1 Tax=Pseudoxanthomonas gei TaxID=1383030 RepID=A0ABX0ABY3_9GAMM|nr:type II secretion system protein GspK [Pseudoxanthomonas gei]NDK38035.1 general secretion pathway protein GspK [Pseudoxanthomonas gei]
MSRQRVQGAALVLVLWLTMLLATLIVAFTLTAGVESMQGKVLGKGAAAQEVARAGVEYALLRVGQADPAVQWLPDGRPYRWDYAGSVVTIRIVDETGKVDLNQAEAPLLSALVRTVGGEPALADGIAAAIIDWRDSDPLTQPAGGAEDPDYAAAGLPYGAKDAPFESVAEVEQVLGMTPELYARLEPSLTLYSGRPQPDPTYAQAPVLTALGLDPGEYEARRRGAVAAIAGQQLVGGGTGTYSIQSHVRTAEGGDATTRTVVRAGGGPVPGSVYTILRWEEAAAPR